MVSACGDHSTCPVASRHSQVPICAASAAREAVDSAACSDVMPSLGRVAFSDDEDGGGCCMSRRALVRWSAGEVTGPPRLVIYSIPAKALTECLA